MLAEEGTTILKLFLHLGREEQTRRLRARLEDPRKHWKFSPSDSKERELWEDYVRAYEAALEKTSTDFAPWCIVPSDTKWYRNLVVASLLVGALEGLKMKYPKPKLDLKKLKL